MRVITAFLLAVMSTACAAGSTEPGVATLAGTATESRTEASEAADPEEALLEFARCMRKHGVDFPDPGSGGDVTIAGRPMEMDEEFREAEKACASFRERAFEAPDLDPKQQAELQQALVEFARCMREHGIDMPDPQPGSNGMVMMAPRDGTMDPRDDEFRAAEKACHDKLPGGGPTFEGVSP